MSAAIDNSLQVSYAMSADDYRRYFAVVNRQRQSRQATFIFLAVFFGAIPVALAFRFIATNPSRHAGDLIGEYSLFAYMIGAIAMLAAGFAVRRVAISRIFAGATNAFGAKTAVFDAAGVTLTGQLSEVRLQWAAIRRFTCESDLLLLWVEPYSAFAVPSRSFESPAACKAAVAFIRARLAEAGAVSMPQ